MKLMTRNRKVFTGELWPIHLKPKEDELLSSWLLRLGVANGVRSCRWWPPTCASKLILGSDVDDYVNEDFINDLVERTGTPISNVVATTLSIYIERLHDSHHASNLAWILPKLTHNGSCDKTAHRPYKRRLKLNDAELLPLPGIQFCTLCLAEDKEPYFRRAWRLSLVTVCPKHRILLLNRCPSCTSKIHLCLYQRTGSKDYKSNVMTICHSCKYDLRKVVNEFSAHNACAKEVELQKTLMNVLNQGEIELQDGEIVKSRDFFFILRQLMAMIRRIWNANINITISKCSGSEPLNLPSIANIRLEFLDAASRARLLSMAYYLLEDWPNRCIRICKDNAIWSSMLIPSNKKDSTPQWYRKVISEHLFNSKYQAAIVQEKFTFLPIPQQQLTVGDDFYINPIESNP